MCVFVYIHIHISIYMRLDTYLFSFLSCNISYDVLYMLGKSLHRNVGFIAQELKVWSGSLELLATFWNCLAEESCLPRGKSPSLVMDRAQRIVNVFEAKKSASSPSQEEI